MKSYFMEMFIEDCVKSRACVAAAIHLLVSHNQSSFRVSPKSFPGPDQHSHIILFTSDIIKPINNNHKSTCSLRLDEPDTQSAPWPEMSADEAKRSPGVKKKCLRRPNKAHIQSFTFSARLISGQR